MQAALCVLWMALCACGVSSSPLRSVQAGENVNMASADDVNILMYGVLQFTESLHHMYQSTEARLARLMKAVSRTESEVKRLGHDTEEAAQNERQIKEKLQLLQAQMKALEIQVHENRDTVTRVELEEAQLKKKLSSLEENLNSSVPDKIKEGPDEVDTRTETEIGESKPTAG
ncbi:uncharacterized protein angptl8 isoform X2 [Puntigrus tetrazona]|uniref:uncharacterized protein angptl8 isoform X2 n=1 Tax=Puntigrus tetrazona TaxID=1606681 RepID=UPI001C89F939|nr:uncharacterized protein angptl8 isoform X2 [Puntigrus tetrazona]